MAKTLTDIQAQIAKLQEQADAIKAKEVAGVVERIKEAIVIYGLTYADIFGGSRDAGTAAGGRGGKLSTLKKGPKAAGKPVPVKFRDDQGNTWSGRGLQPRWLKAALAEGKSLEDFSVA